MTQVRLGLSAPTSDGTGRRPSGSLEWRPSKRRGVAGDVVLPAPFTVGVGAATPPVVNVDPTGPGWAWQVVERVQGGAPKARYLAVPDVGTVVDYADLVAVDPATLEPVLLSNAWWTQVTDYVATHGGSGGGAVASVNTKTGAVVLSASDVGAQPAGSYVTTADARLTDQRVPTDSSVTNVKVATGAAINADKLADGTTNKVLTATERTKLTGIATGATANATDAQLRDRATHTGTQSADTLTDGATNMAFLGTERTKLAGIATGATANSTDATLLARANHTGTQAASTITGLGTAALVNTGTASGNVPLLSTGGVLPIARLASGTPDGTKFVRDDGTLAVPAGGGGSSGLRPNLVAVGRFYAGGMTAGSGITATSSNRAYISPFWCPQAITIDQLIVECTTAAAGVTTTLGYYPNQSGDTPVGATVQSLGTIDTTTVGVLTLTLGTPLSLPAGWSHFAANVTAAPRFRSNAMDDTVPAVYGSNAVVSGQASVLGLFAIATSGLPATWSATATGAGIRFAVRISSIP